jgi:hypothetical protein
MAVQHWLGQQQRHAAAKSMALQHWLGQQQRQTLLPLQLPQQQVPPAGSFPVSHGNSCLAMALMIDSWA